MTPIIIDNGKDLVITILTLIILLKISVVIAYYKGMRDTQSIINSALSAEQKKYNTVIR